MKIFSFLIIAIACFGATSGAQSIWTDRDRDRAISVELIVPNFGGNATVYSGYVLTLSSRFSVTNSLHLVIEAPFVHGNITTSFSSQSQNIAGNPYLGLEIATRKPFLYMEAGARIPIVSDEQDIAATIGGRSDIDRFEAYAPNIVQISGAVNIQPVITSGLGFRLRIGPTYDIAIRQHGNTVTTQNSDLYLLYSEQLYYKNELVNIGLGLTGRTILTNSRTNDRTVDMFEIAGKMYFGKFEPGMTMRLPLDRSLANVLDFTYGFTVEMVL
jgi:hypothetical protein